MDYDPDNPIVIKKIARHRNGVAGEGFHVVTFYDQELGDQYRMVAVLFGLDEDSRQKWNGRCAVLNIDMLDEGIIEFGANSWRGDQYESALREAIERYDEEQWAALLAKKENA